MFGSVFAVKKIKEKIEYDKIIIDLKEENIELNYGDTINVDDLLLKYDGGEIEIDNNVDFNTVGEYKVVYKVKGKNGLEKKKEISIKILDNIPPTLALDNDNINVKLNEEIDLLSGVKAEDNYDKDITNKITITGEVDTTKEGTYQIKYDVKDSSNNSAETKTRTYIVKKEPTLQIGKTYECSNSQGGENITLKENNVVKATAWATMGGGTEYRGTYTINGNILTVTLTEMNDYIEWVSLPSEYQKPKTYTIVEDNHFKDEKGNIYMMK